jgi:GNAT superfamily N-acetyltransferase
MNRRQREMAYAIEVFVRGHCAGKSRTFPYEARRIRSLWVMRDAPRKNPRDYRKEEWIAYAVDAIKVDAMARCHSRGRFFVGAMVETGASDEPTRAAYRSLGYRLLATEGFFVQRLQRIPKVQFPLPIERVRTPELASRLAQATRSRPILPSLLASDAPFRQYVALDGQEIVGRVRSVDAVGATWCADMHVNAPYRRRGIGQALLCRMLRDDRARGAKCSVLTASHLGALLYPRLGYERIGTLLLFAPRKD